MNPNEIRQKRLKLLEEARQIITKAETEKRDVSNEERTQIDGRLTNAAVLLGDAQRGEAIEKLEAAERSLGQTQGRSGNPLPHEDPANTRNGVLVYSVMKAMRQQLSAREGTGRLDGLELEVHIELAKRLVDGRTPKGVMVPWSLGSEGRAGRPRQGESRALDTTAGTGTIATILDTSLIELLRARTVLDEAGATIMSDMQGLFAIPRQNQAATAQWVSEGSAPTGANQTADQVPFTPRTISAFTDYTRRFMEQTNQDAEIFVRNDLMKIIARAVDLAGLSGTGSSNQPRGVTANGSVGTVSNGTNGGFPTWTTIVGLESKVAVANADMGKLRYITDAAVRGVLKTTPIITASPSFPEFLWDRQSPVTPLNSYPVSLTNQLSAVGTKGTGTALHTIVYGNWEDLVIAFWSGIDILVDPYTGSSSGTIRVVALQDADINVRHPESFSYMNDVQVV
jgi:HK97 family phage major capsid protein